MGDHLSHAQHSEVTSPVLWIKAKEAKVKNHMQLAWIWKLKLSNGQHSALGKNINRAFLFSHSALACGSVFSNLNSQTGS